ncbi:uncharacterized protein J4E84_003806 [Alternaria hordeiaustralica]|uniref:uncharacterized protein n=1 Tax=Alternaria hordeiaustralica TaxID=1187925 RepID=UPI0020C3FAA1|nr:uncharacterized protein J4E84_003806 [Alternaria hordeiaustralica]KAI4691512.1 hypothetical protein J4E84_003806 [Alternaria hordeiaustralica]
MSGYEIVNVPCIAYGYSFLCCTPLAHGFLVCVPFAWQTYRIRKLGDLGGTCVADILKTWFCTEHSFHSETGDEAMERIVASEDSTLDLAVMALPATPQHIAFTAPARTTQSEIPSHLDKSENDSHPDPASEHICNNGEAVMAE